MNRNQDRAYHREIDNVLTFLVLCEGGFGVPDMGFFDGAMMGWKSQIKEMTRSVFGERQPRAADYDRISDGLKSIRGAIVVREDDPEQFALAGANEMDYFAKKRLGKFVQKQTSVYTPGFHADVFDPAFDPSHGLISEPINPMDRIIETRSVFIDQAGRAKPAGTNYYILNRKNKRWYPVRPETGEISGHSMDGLGFVVGVISTSIGLTQWRTNVGFHGHKPRVGLITDPTGLKEFFRFRDIPEGKHRRDALLHWVAEHWRQNRNDPDVENYVREHLRGAREFHWHGLDVEIVIPDADLNKQEAAIEGRKRLKQKQLDRRLREWRRSG